MAKQIKGEQIIEKDALKNAIEDARALKKVYEELDQTAIKMSQDISKASRGLDLNNANDVKNLIALEKQMNVATSQHLEVKKKKVQLDKEEARLLGILEANKQKEIKTEIILRKEQERQEKQTKRNVTEYSKLSSKLNDQRKRYKDLIITQGRWSRETRKAGKEVSLLDSKLKKIDASAGQFQRNVGNYPSAFRGLSSSLASFGVALGGAAIFKNVVGIFSDFQNESANLASVLGKSRKEITRLTEDAKRLGAATAFTASQVLQLQTEYAKLGFTEKQILDATEATLQLAQATGTELGEAAAIAGATLGGFGLEADQTQRVVDLMAKSFTTSALDMNKFSESMKAAAPAAKATGVSIETTTALLGTMANAGISGSKAGNALKNVFIQLNAQGLTLEKGFEKVSNSTDKLGTATKLVGKEAAAAFLVLADGTEETEKLQQGLENAGGAAEKMANEQLDTLSGQTKLLNSAWEGFILSLEDGDGVIAKVLRGAINLATEFLEVLTKLSMSEHQIQVKYLKELNELGSEKFIENQAKLNELYTKSNDELQKMVANNADLSSYASRILKLRQENIDKSQIEFDILVKQNAILGKTAADEARNFKSKFSNLTEEERQEKKRLIAIETGLANKSKELVLTKLKALNEQQLTSIIENRDVLNAKTVRLAEKELQRRKDITVEVEKSTSDTKGTGKNVKNTEKEINLLSDLKKQLQQVNVERANELIVAGETKRLELLTEQAQMLQNQIDHYEEILNKQKEVNAPENVLPDISQEDVDNLDKIMYGEDEEVIIENLNNFKSLWEQKTEILKTATQAFEYFANMRNAALDKEIAKQDEALQASKDREQEIRELRKLNTVDAAQNLAFEQEQQAKALAKKEELERKKARNEMIIQGLNLLSSNIQSGSANPTGESLAQLTAFTVALKNLPLFSKGTDYNVASSLGAPMFSGQDGYAVRVDGEETILSIENSRKVRGMHQNDIVRGAELFRKGFLIENNSQTKVPVYKDVTNTHDIAIVDELKKLNNKPVSTFDSNIDRNILTFISSKESEGRKVKTIRRHR